MEKNEKKVFTESLKKHFAILIRNKIVESGESKEEFSNNIGICERELSYLCKGEKLINTTTLFLFLSRGIITVEDLEKEITNISAFLDDLGKENE